MKATSKLTREHVETQKKIMDVQRALGVSFFHVLTLRASTRGGPGNGFMHYETREAAIAEVTRIAELRKIGEVTKALLEDHVVTLDPDTLKESFYNRNPRGRP